MKVWNDMATLVRQRRSLKAGIKLARREMYDLQIYLTSPKFEKPDDYIRTWEVTERLRKIDNLLYVAIERAGL